MINYLKLAVLVCVVAALPAYAADPTPVSYPLHPSVTTTPFAGTLPAKTGDILLSMDTGIILGFKPGTETFYLWSGYAGNGPKAGLAVNPANLNEVYAVLSSLDQVVRYDSDGNSLDVVGTIPSTEEAGRLSFNPADGSVWMTDKLSFNLLRLPPGGGTASVLTFVSNWPTGVRVGPDGQLYVANNASGSVSKWDITTDPVNPTLVYNNPQGHQHQDLNFDCAGRLWLATNNQTLGEGHLYEIDPADGAFVRELDSFSPLIQNSGGPLYSISAVQQDLDGYLWVLFFNGPGWPAALLKVNPDSLEPIRYLEIPQVVDGYDQGSNYIPLAVALLGVPEPLPGCASNLTWTVTPTITVTATVTMTATPPSTGTATATLQDTPLIQNPPDLDSPGVVFPAPIHSGDQVVNFGVPMACEGQLTVKVWNLRGDWVGEVNRRVRPDAAGNVVAAFVSNGLAPGVYFYQAESKCDSGAHRKLKPGKFLVKP